MSFSNDVIEQVWRKGQTVLNNNPDEWRNDQCKAWIGKRFYGNRNSQYGWEIDHIDTNSNNNSLTNLRPLQWENNADKQSGYLNCPIVVQDVKNVRRW